MSHKEFTPGDVYDRARIMGYAAVETISGQPGIRTVVEDSRECGMGHQGGGPNRVEVSCKLEAERHQGYLNSGTEFKSTLQFDHDGGF